MKHFVIGRLARGSVGALALAGIAVAAAASAAPAVPAADGDVAFYDFEAPDWTLGTLNNQHGWTMEEPSDWQVTTANPYSGTQNLRAKVVYDMGNSSVFGPTVMNVGTKAFSVASTRVAIHNSGSGSDQYFSPTSAVATNYDPWNVLAVTRVRMKTDGSISALQPGFQWGATTGSITDENYHLLKVIAKNTGDKSIEICLDGQSIYTGPNIAAASSSNAYIDTIWMQSAMPEGSVGSTVDYDDMRIQDTDFAVCADASDWNFDGVVAPALPTGWTSQVNAAGSQWFTQSDSADSAPNAAHAAEQGTSAESTLSSAAATVGVAGGQLSFRHRWNVEENFDGGALEMAIDDGPFVDILAAGGSFVEGGYNGELSDGSNPIGKRAAWTGTQQDYATTTVDLPAAAAGHSVRFRWRLGSNHTGVASGDNGWWIDTVVLSANTVPTQPSAVVAPEAINVTLDLGAQASAPLTVANAGGGTLTYDIPGFAAAQALPPRPKAATSGQRAGFAFTKDHRVASGLRGRDLLLDAGAGINLSQTAEQAPQAPDSISCGSDEYGSSATSWWRRFYFDEHSRVGASARIDSVTVASESGPQTPATINLYSVPHGDSPDTIPLDHLTPIGSGTGTVGGVLQTSTIAVDGLIDDTVGQDLVVEYHIDGSTGGQFYPGANPSAQTHPTFVSAEDCGTYTPTDAATLGSPDFHLVMVVNVADAQLPAACSDASALSWLSATPSTGALGFGASADVTLGFDGSALDVGAHDAVMCLTTNDADHAVVQVPLHVQVNAGDRIFDDGFELQ